MPKQRKKICHTCDKDSTSVPSHKSKLYTRAKSKKKTQPEKEDINVQLPVPQSFSVPEVSTSRTQTNISQDRDNLVSLVPTIVTEVIRNLGEAGLLNTTRYQVVNNAQQEESNVHCQNISTEQTPSFQADSGATLTHNMPDNLCDGVNVSIPQQSHINFMPNTDSVPISQTVTCTPSFPSMLNVSPTPEMTSSNRNIQSAANATPTPTTILPNVSQPVQSSSTTSGGLNLMGQTLQKLLTSGKAQGGSDCVVITDDVASFTDSQLPLQVPLGLGISQNLKQKIINEEYIDFYQLLQYNPTESLTLNFTQNGEGQTVAIAPGKSKDKKITNFNTWLKAFEIYVAIYSPSHPDKTPGLMKYASNMRELNDTYGSAAWAYYDKAFRKWRQYNKTFPWGVLYWEFYAKAMAAGRTNNRNISSTNNFEQAFQPFRSSFKQKDQRLCKLFAYKGQCKFDPCKFKHACPICNGRHPLFKCFRNNATGEHDSQKQNFSAPQGAKADNLSKTNKSAHVKSNSAKSTNSN